MADLQDYIAKMDKHKRLRFKKDFDTQTYALQTLKLMKKQKGIIYIAKEKGDFAGYIFGIIVSFSGIENLEQYPIKDGRIAELFVNPEYRGKKVGFLLMEKMEHYFKTHGCNSVRLECFMPNKKAHKFYKKLGYEDRTMSMLKTLK